jgi:folate-binding protein YgfZ
LGAFLTQKGKLVSDALILKLSEKIILILPPGYGARVKKHLEIFLNFADCVLQDIKPPWDLLAVLGPLASTTLGGVLGVDLPEEKQPVLAVPFLHQHLIVFRSERLGVHGWEILAPQEISGSLAEKFLKPDALPVGLEVLEMLRVEAGLPRMGQDMSEEHLVAEVGLDERATSFNKGCYLGQETTARVHTMGHVNRSLCRLLLEKPIRKQLPLEIFQGEKNVGRISSLVDSFKYGKPLALGMLQSKALASKEPLHLETAAGRIGVDILSESGKVL